MPSGRRGQIKRVHGRRRASTDVDARLHPSTRVYVRRRASRNGRRRTSTDVDALGVNGPLQLTQPLNKFAHEYLICISELRVYYWVRAELVVACKIA